MDIKNMKDVLHLAGFLSIICFLAWVLSGCTLHAGVDWSGVTGVSKTTISKDFVTTKKPIEERRY